MIRAALFLAAVLAAAGVAAAPADDLARLRERIAAVERALADERARRDELLDQLEALERELGTTGRALRRLQERLRETRREIAALRRERDGAAATVERHRKLLRSQLRAAYAAGRAERVRLLLNQEDPARLGRILAYHGYLGRARLREMERLRAEIARLERLEAELGRRTAELERLRAATAARREALTASRRARSALVARLETRLRDRGRELERLRADAARLEALLRSLERDLAQLPDTERTPFARLRGRLPWPVQGRVLARFGAPRRGGGPRWRGLLIAAPAGRGIRAVSHGRVAFADWLRGYGLLLIIDHGDGYMSLYAHADALYKETGEWVEAGEVVAAVGASGGRSAPALYFELRKDGRPLDPGRWLARRLARVN